VGLSVLSHFLSFNAAIKEAVVKVHDAVSTHMQPLEQPIPPSLPPSPPTHKACLPPCHDTTTTPTATQVLLSLPSDDRLHLLGLAGEPASFELIPLPGPEGVFRCVMRAEWWMKCVCVCVSIYGCVLIR
jgi:hypothetical protein